MAKGRFCISDDELRNSNRGCGAMYALSSRRKNLDNCIESFGVNKGRRCFQAGHDFLRATKYRNLKEKVNEIDFKINLTAS